MNLLNQFEVVVNVVSALAFIFLLITHRKTTADAVQKGLDGAQTLTKELEPFIEGTPLSPYFNVIEEIEKAAMQGVKFAEQMHKENGGSVDRSQIALDFVHNALTELGVEISDRIQKLIDGAIKAAVYVLKSEQPDPVENTDPPAAPEPAPVPEHVQQLLDAAKTYAGKIDAPAAPAPTPAAATATSNTTNQ